MPLPTRSYERLTPGQIERACIVCSRLFYMCRAELERSGGFYCSKECRGGTEERACRACGKTFRVGRGDLRKCDGAGSYCSRECYWANKPKPLEQRFWAKVEKTDGCWRWTGANSGREWPYGLLGAGPGDRTLLKAHHVSWEIHFGKVPDGFWVLHHCDNTLCVRPDHLFLGTAADNTADMMRKDRCQTRKLTWPEVRQIRKIYAVGATTQAELAEEYDVCNATIWLIVNGQTWKH